MVGVYSTDRRFNCFYFPYSFWLFVCVFRKGNGKPRVLFLVLGDPVLGQGQGLGHHCALFHSEWW